jgi:hypothetical protein
MIGITIIIPLFQIINDIREFITEYQQQQQQIVNLQIIYENELQINRILLNEVIFIYDN